MLPPLALKISVQAVSAAAEDERDKESGKFLVPVFELTERQKELEREMQEGNEERIRRRSQQAGYRSLDEEYRSRKWWEWFWEVFVIRIAFAVTCLAIIGMLVVAALALGGVFDAPLT